MWFLHNFMIIGSVIKVVKIAQIKSDFVNLGCLVKKIVNRLEDCKKMLEETVVQVYNYFRFVYIVIKLLFFTI